ncbi:MAG: D-alanine-D-alanine ligase [Sulfurimonas sp.]|jgi:D-alanine-D-alanine ligase
MKIEIITTENSALKETGFGDIQACENVLKSVNSMGHDTTLSTCKTVEELNEVVNRKPDLVILAVKYIVSEDGEMIWLSEFFEKNNINFSGSQKDTLMFDSNKVLAKSYLKDRSISTARYFTAVPGEYSRDYEIPINYPLFVKPSDAANGNGVDEFSFVNSYCEFESKVQSLHTLYNMPVLVEEYLDGQEFTVAMIKTRGGDLLISAVEVIPPQENNGVRILGQKIIQSDPEGLKKIEDRIIMDRVKKLAVDVYMDLGIRDYGRIDIKTNKSGQCFFMEANLVPGMSNDSSYFPKAFEMEYGLSYDNIIEFIVDEGISRIK